MISTFNGVDGLDMMDTYLSQVSATQTHDFIEVMKEIPDICKEVYEVQDTILGMMITIRDQAEKMGIITELEIELVYINSSEIDLFLFNLPDEEE